MRRSIKKWALALGLTCATMSGVIVPSTADAEIKNIEADGMYIMGDGTKENPAVAKERARDDAKRAAIEKACVYVESLTEVRKGLVTEDVIRTVSSNVLQVKSSDINVEVAEGNALIFHCHVVALVDSDPVMGQLRLDGAELAEATRRNKELETQVEKVNAELSALKEQYADATSEAEKDQIREQVRLNEQKFEARQLLEQGNDLMKTRDFYAAIRSYREALIADPSNSIVCYRLGDAYREIKDFDSAVSHYRKALQLDASYADAYNNLGFTFELMKNFDDAVLNYRKAVECDDQYAGAYYNLGNIYYRNRDYRQAIDNYRRTVEINDRFIVAYNNLGLAYENLGEFDKAIDSFTQAIENAPDKSGRNFAGLYNNRGTCWQRMERFDEALSDYSKAIEIDPDYAEPRGNREQLSAWLSKTRS